MTIRKRKRTSFEEWLQWREPNINASEAPAMFGADNFCTPLQLFYRKTGMLDVQETRRMRLGRWFEPAVIEATREEYPGWTITPHHHYYDDPDFRVGCTPDAVMLSPDGERYNLQCKLVGEHSFRRFWAHQDEDEAEEQSGYPSLLTVPLGYELQTNIETNMGGFIGGKIAALVIERAQVYVFDVPKHEHSYQEVKEEAQIFWERVKSNSPPPIDMRKDQGLIKKLYPTDDGSTIDLSDHPDLLNYVAEETAIKAKVGAENKKLKPYKDRRKDIRTLVSYLMGSASRAILPGYEITYKTVERKASKARTLIIKELKE